MSLLADEIARALNEIGSLTLDAGEPPKTFVWRNKEYPAVAAIEVASNLFGAGGLTPDNSLTLTVRRDVFDTVIPQPDQFLTFNPSERKYRIDIVKPDTTGTSLILLCNDPNRAAGIIEREI